MTGQPLCEVFGYPVDNTSSEAVRSRQEKLCPFNNRVPQCTKTSRKNPLGVCSVWSNGQPVIICPVRFRQDWLVIENTKRFLLSNTLDTDFVTEATLKSASDEEIGNIDAVLVKHTEDGQVTDFGILEIQAVYISGNVRNPFSYFMGVTDSWDGADYPRPDWLSSVKRLVRQLTVKGVIFSNWEKKMAVAVQKQFYLEHLPQLKDIEETPVEDANVAWFLYGLIFNTQTALFEIKLERTIYMTFESMLESFSKVEAGSIEDFTEVLSKKLRRKLHIKLPQKPNSNR